MIRCQEQAKGIVFSVKAHAGARKNAITGEHDGAIKVSVSQAPEKGKANKAIVEVLASALRLSNSQLALLQGEASSQKQFVVRDLTLDELESRITAALASIAKS